MKVKKQQLRTGHGTTTDWFKIEKRVSKAVYCDRRIFNLYEEYIMQNVGLDESQAGIKIARRNIINLRYTTYTSDDTIH